MFDDADKRNFLSASSSGLGVVGTVGGVVAVPVKLSEAAPPNGFVDGVACRRCNSSSVGAVGAVAFNVNGLDAPKLPVLVEDELGSPGKDAVAEVLVVIKPVGA